MKLKLTTMTVAILIATASLQASATLIGPGTSQAATSVSAYFGGVLVTQATTFVTTPSYSGWARTALYNTGSGIDFYYQFTNLATSISGIERLSAYNFGSYVVDAYQTATAFGIFQAGTENIDTVDRGTLGVIGFNFLPTGTTKIQPGTTSYIGILRTNAPSYTSGAFGILDGYAGNATGFAPIGTPIPEPTPLTLLILGAGIMALAKYWKPSGIKKIMPTQSSI